MGFDFAKAFEDAKADLKNNKLFLLLLGASGNGKSFAQGTFGTRTLYLYTQGERHGSRAASITGKENMISVCLDQVEGQELTADESLKRLHTILDDTDGIKKGQIGAIALDGITELESLIRNSTKFKVMTTTDAGKHNGFAESGATLFQLKEIISKLKRVQRECNVHVCATEILNVKEMDEKGTVVDSTPQLIGYAVATGVVQQFDDVLIIGRMKKGDKTDYRFQLLAESNKTALNQDGTIKKTFNFSPRLSGVDILNLPATLSASLFELTKLKEGNVK